MELIWTEIDLQAVSHNIQALRKLTRPETKFMAVVKANAYGHGAVEVARCAVETGADYLGVARLPEAIELRQAGIQKPILIFGYTSDRYVDQLIEWDLTQTAFDIDTCRRLSDTAKNRKIKIHLKVDTGMGRLGFLIDELTPFASESASINSDLIGQIEKIARMPGIFLEGVYTHFASADSADKSYAQLQIQRFQNLIGHIDHIDIPIKHAANSAAIIELPEAHFDMVRAGISLYGLYPSDEVQKDRIDLKPAMTLKARIIQLKGVPAGFSISYGMTRKTEKPTTIAAVPVGYADGYNRRLSSKSHMLVCGHRAPVMGRVCMDLTMLDVGHIPEAKVGAEVTVFGGQAKNTVSADELAVLLDTINYEIVSTVARRAPRIYV